MSKRRIDVLGIMFPFLFATGIAATDLYIKEKMENELLEEDEEIEKGCLIFRRHHNKGAILNIGEDKYEKEIRGISVFGSIATFFALMVSMTKRGKFLEKAGLSLLLGGSISNTCDRVNNGYVMDYASLKVKNKKVSKLVFNLADVCILIGSLFVMISNLSSKD